MNPDDDSAPLTIEAQWVAAVGTWALPDPASIEQKQFLLGMLQIMPREDCGLVITAVVGSPEDPDGTRTFQMPLGPEETKRIYEFLGHNLPD